MSDKLTKAIVVACVLASIALVAVAATVPEPPAPWPAWAQRLAAEQYGEGDVVIVPDDEDAPRWVLELWHAEMGDLSLMFRVRPRAFPNGTIRLDPYPGGEDDRWWVSWPADGSVLIRRATVADFGG